MRDTSPAATDRYFEGLRALSPAQRLQRAASLSGAVRRLAEAGARQMHPEASDLQIRALVVKRLYGSGVARRFFEPELESVRRR